MNGLQAYLLRVAIGLDAFIESFFHFGLLGVTISSRIGTAAAHGHRWGKVGWWLLDRVWPFGCDADGTPHCVSAIEHDIARALRRGGEVLKGCSCRSREHAPG